MKFNYPLLENAFTKGDISEGIKVIKSEKLTMGAKTIEFEKDLFPEIIINEDFIGSGNFIKILKIVLPIVALSIFGRLAALSTLEIKKP